MSEPILHCKERLSDNKRCFYIYIIRTKREKSQ
nr:MAG TPA: hypothetical protein [Caudoviricetes sp.]